MTLKRREGKLVSKVVELENKNKELVDKYEKGVELINADHHLSHSIDISVPQSDGSQGRNI